MGNPEITFARDRVKFLLERLEQVASGESRARLQISPLHDELDAIAFGINVLVDELQWAHRQIIESERRKTAERDEALRLSDANFATAFHSNPCMMTISRLSDGRLQNVNASFERQTGFSRDEVIGRTSEEFGMWVDPDDAAALRSALSEGKVGSREIRIRTKRGAMVTAICSAAIVTLDGERCVLGAGFDVTERRNAEIQAAALREELAHLARVTMIEALAGSLAHEISQPLTAVMANAESAVRLATAEPPRLHELRETLNEIRSDNRRAGEVLQRIRALLKKGDSQFEPVDLNAIISDVTKLIHGTTLARQIALGIDLANVIEPVMGDRIQIQQVVLNLLMNAFDAVQPRGSAHRLVFLKTSCRNSAAVVEVRDHGTGLSDEELARIFEPFYTTKRDGIGLGLSICQAIVAAHGGALSATRNAGTGMTFFASFPVRRTHPDESPKSAAHRLQERR